jgi:hypothetical protein
MVLGMVQSDGHGWVESSEFVGKIVRRPFGSCGLRGNPRSTPF